MPGESKDGSATCSRRSLLVAAVAAVSAAAAAASDPAAAAAAMKISEAAVAYQDQPDGDKQCSKCMQFLAPSSCKMVDGTISPHGYCRIFTPRQSAAAPWGALPRAG
jgi:hypothetical protein